MKITKIQFCCKVKKLFWDVGEDFPRRVPSEPDELLSETHKQNAFYRVPRRRDLWHRHHQLLSVILLFFCKFM